MSTATAVRPLPDLPRLTKRQRAKLQVRTAYRRTRGVDPTRHLWYQTGAKVKRVCDDGDWWGDVLAGDDGGFDVSCPTCSNLRFEDSVYGFGLFRFCLDLPGFYGKTGHGWGADRYNVRMPNLTLQSLSDPKPECVVKMTSFADFCDAEGYDDRLRKVRKQVAGEKDSSRSFDHYGKFRLAVEDHIKTNDLKRVASSFLNLSGERLLMLGSQYVAYFEGRTDIVRFLPPYKGLVEIEGLGINVNPDILIRNRDGDEQLLTLWLLKNPLSQRARQVLSFLFRRARGDWGWPIEWGFGIFDIQNEIVRQEVATDSDFDDWVGERAGEYLSMHRIEVEKWEIAEEKGLIPPVEQRQTRAETRPSRLQPPLWPENGP